jgi:hypothetical protein
MKQTPLIIARKHVANPMPMQSSARLCLADAVRHADAGNLRQSELHALKSLAYSIGYFHADYVKAWRQVFGDAPVRFPMAVDFMDARDMDEAVSV